MWILKPSLLKLFGLVQVQISLMRTPSMASLAPCTIAPRKVNRDVQFDFV